MKKVLSLIIVIALLATQFVLPAFAVDGEATIENVTITATRDLIDRYDGNWDVEYDEEENEIDVFVYDTSAAEFWFELEMSDGETFSGDMWDVSGYLDTEFISDNIVCYDENHIGTYEVEISCEYFTETVEVNIVENPVESVKAEATKALVENWTGEWVEYWEDEECVEYFYYDVYQAYPYYTITYKDGTVYEGYDEEIWEQTGYYVFDVDTQADTPWTVGKNTAKASFLGVECEFEVEVAETPVESIEAEATFPLYENYSGSWEYFYDENGNETEYFRYDVYETEPMFTITYEDGSTFTGTDEEIYWETGVWTYDETEQASNPWTVGENTANMSYLGHEFEVVIEVQESPVESVVLTEENGLTIEIKYKDDETVDKAKAIDFLVEMVDYQLKTYIITENGMIECEIYATEDEETQEFYISVLGVESNKLDNCDWFNATMYANEVAYSSLIYATGCKELYDKDFTGYNSADENPDLTQMVALATYLCEYDPEIDEPYFYHNLGTDVINEDLAMVFGVNIEDFTGVDGYDAETGMVEIFEPMESAYEFETKDMNFVDGKWEKIYRVVELETGKVDILKVVLNEDMTIDRIVFRMFGDVTGDGKVGALDARWILQHVALTKEFDEAQKLAADTNGDGKLCAIDARGVLQFVAGSKEF